jgi:hypothetical protein
MGKYRRGRFAAPWLDCARAVTIAAEALQCQKPMRNDLFGNDKHVKELERILADGEPQRRKREAARNKALDRLLMVVMIALVLLALTRIAVWLARIL